jgi:hypothetical protein
MTNELNSPLVEASFDRRGLFRIGGLTVASAVIIAACGSSQGGDLGRVGNGAPTPTLQDPIVNNSVLLRTSASLETSIADAYDHILKKGSLAGDSITFPQIGDQTDLITLYAEHHRKAADTFNSLAQEAGGETWTCGNPRLDSAFIEPIFVRSEDGVPATDAAPAIPPSDDLKRDMLNLVLTLELLSAASCQALMPQVTEPSFRAEPIRIAVRSSRQAALLSLRMNPGIYTPAEQEAAAAAAAAATTTTVAAADAAPPQTEIPLPAALPSRYGSLAPIVYIGGHGDENGVRQKLSFETPSLNSFVYPFDTCA